MAKKITEILIDDIDGNQIESGAGETVHFSLDGENYEIDLTTANAEELRSALERFISAGRRISGGRSRQARRTSAPPSHDLQAVRAWLREAGHPVSDRGRIPRHLLEKYEASNAR